MNPASTITFPLASTKDTKRLAKRIAPHLKAGDLVVLSGPLGSGKTFFTRALCRALGLPEEVRVPSPTFTLVHEHATKPPLAHADVYRLKDEVEVEQLGLDAQREDGYLVVVEWGEPYIHVLGGDALVVRFSLDPRRAELLAVGPSASKLLEAVRDS
jgi:tRNA threonylcarbamoyladenosine biosynthesis protein TsaE